MYETFSSNWISQQKSFTQVLANRFLRWRPSFFLGTIQMGAFLFLVLALVIGAGVAYKMGYLDPYTEQIKQQAGKQ
ncbi:hypothetical protein Tcan_10792 [Toxocara canis]|nr:hypothetical protein Tcan_10792 [Toxocara canis]